MPQPEESDHHRGDGRPLAAPPPPRKKARHGSPTSPADDERADGADAGSEALHYKLAYGDGDDMVPQFVATGMRLTRAHWQKIVRARVSELRRRISVISGRYRSWRCGQLISFLENAQYPQLFNAGEEVGRDYRDPCVGIA